MNSFDSEYVKEDINEDYKNALLSKELNGFIYDRIDSMKILNNDFESMNGFCKKMKILIERKKINLAEKIKESRDTENFYMGKFQELLKNHNKFDNDINLSYQINYFLNTELDDKKQINPIKEESYVLAKNLFYDINSVREKIEKKINLVNTLQINISKQESIIEKKFSELTNEQKEIYNELLNSNKFDYTTNLNNNNRNSTSINQTHQMPNLTQNLNLSLNLDYYTKTKEVENNKGDKHNTNNTLGEISVIFERLKEENFFEKICETEINSKNTNNNNLTPIKWDYFAQSGHLVTDPISIKNNPFSSNKNINSNTDNTIKNPERESKFYDEDENHSLNFDIIKNKSYLQKKNYDDISKFNIIYEKDYYQKELSEDEILNENLFWRTNKKIMKIEIFHNKENLKNKKGNDSPNIPYILKYYSNLLLNPYEEKEYFTDEIDYQKWKLEGFVKTNFPDEFRESYEKDNKIIKKSSSTSRIQQKYRFLGKNNVNNDITENKFNFSDKINNKSRQLNFDFNNINKEFKSGGSSSEKITSKKFVEKSNQTTEKNKNKIKLKNKNRGALSEDIEIFMKEKQLTKITELDSVLKTDKNKKKSRKKTKIKNFISKKNFEENIEIVLNKMKEKNRKKSKIIVYDETISNLNSDNISKKIEKNFENVVIKSASNNRIKSNNEKISSKSPADNHVLKLKKEKLNFEGPKNNKINPSIKYLISQTEEESKFNISNSNSFILTNQFNISKSKSNKYINNNLDDLNISEINIANTSSRITDVNKRTEFNISSDNFSLTNNLKNDYKKTINYHKKANWKLQNNNQSDNEKKTSYKKQEMKEKEQNNPLLIRNKSDIFKSNNQYLDNSNFEIKNKNLSLTNRISISNNNNNKKYFNFDKNLDVKKTFKISNNKTTIPALSKETYKPRINLFPHIKSKYEYLNKFRKGKFEEGLDARSIEVAINITPIQNKFNHFGDKAIYKNKVNYDTYSVKFIENEDEEQQTKQITIKSKMFNNKNKFQAFRNRVDINNIFNYKI